MNRHETIQSHVRRDLARHIVAMLPPAWERFALEIALTGSASRGVSDADSDIELNFWGHALPSIEERDAWLHDVGATDVALAVDISEEGTIWDRWRFAGVRVEAGWQPTPLLEAHLQAMLRAEQLDHAHLTLAEVVAHALPLRTSGSLATWRAWLAHYPDELQRRLTNTILARWDSPYISTTRWSPVRRGQLLTLTEEITGDVHAVLRLLFALNREWEPDWKWIAVLHEQLARKPEHLIDCIAACFGSAPPAARMRACTQLILDTLALFPPSEQLARIRAYLERGL